MNRASIESSLRSDPGLRAVREMLGAGDAWVVGGWIRDRALGGEAADLDLILGAGSDEKVRRLAEGLGLKAHFLGKAGRQCWLMAAKDGGPIRWPQLGGDSFPVSRIEIWPLGELSLEEDALRRDFSINALIWPLPDGPLIDLAGGLQDLQDRRLRVIRRENLVEDSLRLMRAPRFLATFPDFQLDDQSAEWIRELAPSLALAPEERIGAEILKLSRAVCPARGLWWAEDLGVLKHAGPAGGVPGPHRMDLQALFDMGRMMRFPAGNAEAFLGFVVAYWGISSLDQLAAYAWPRESSRVAFIAAREYRDARRIAAGGWKERREAMYRWGRAFPAVLNLASSVARSRGEDCGPWRRWWRQYRRSGERLLNLRLPLNGNEISRLTGIEAGPELGRVIAELEGACIRREVLSVAGAERRLRRKFSSAESLRESP